MKLFLAVSPGCEILGTAARTLAPLTNFPCATASRTANSETWLVVPRAVFSRLRTGQRFLAISVYSFCISRLIGFPAEKYWDLTPFRPFVKVSVHQVEFIDLLVPLYLSKSMAYTKTTLFVRYTNILIAYSSFHSYVWIEALMLTRWSIFK